MAERPPSRLSKSITLPIYLPSTGVAVQENSATIVPGKRPGREVRSAVQSQLAKIYFIPTGQITGSGRESCSEGLSSSEFYTSI